MPDTIPFRVARRFLSTLRAATIVHHDRDGVVWGWLSNSVPRMHLTPLNDALRDLALVWLEDGTGVRCFEPDPRYTPTRLNLDGLRASLARTRNSVEWAWLQTCERKGWLDYSPSAATVTMYGGTAQQRTLCLKDDAYRPEYLQVDMATNSACLELRLNRMIWSGADDGSDAMEMATARRTRA